MTDGLKDRHREAIIAEIAANDRVERAVLFGSRATGTNTVSSDVDIALFGNRLTLTDQARLAAALDELPMAQSVDLLMYDSIQDRTLREHIRRQGVEWYARPTRDEGTNTSSDSVSEWPVVTVEDLSEKVAMGPFGSSIKVSTFVPDGVPIISGQHLRGVRVDDAPGFNFITREHAKRLANANVRRGDVIFTHAGNIGQVAYVPECSHFDRYVISQRQFYMRCDSSKAIPEFVALYFTSAEGQHQLLANASQVGVPSIAQPVTYLRTLQVPLPPLSEQRAIAHILGTLDDKIELNRRMNETLEAMARALFKSWFVDFDPVRAKMAGRDTGLPKHLADLFPDRLVDSELGKIPEGWEVKALGDVLELTYGKALKADSRRGGSVPVYGSNGRVGWHDEKLAEGPGIVVGRKGNPGVVNWISTDFFAIDTTFIVLPKGGTQVLPFLFFALKQQDLPSIAADSAVPGLNRHLAYMNRQLIPDAAVVERFDKQGGIFFTRRSQLEGESHVLATVRDTLLPKLVSGEIRLHAAERAVENIQ